VGHDGTSGQETSTGALMSDADLENLPAPLREALSQPGVSPQLVSMTLAAFSASSWADPLPPADQIRAYEEVLPGSADRILAMAERQQEHRQNLERVTVDEAASRSRWGLRLGFVLAILVIGVGRVGARAPGDRRRGWLVRDDCSQPDSLPVRSRFGVEAPAGAASLQVDRCQPRTNRTRGHDGVPWAPDV